MLLLISGAVGGSVVLGLGMKFELAFSQRTSMGSTSFIKASLHTDNKFHSVRVDGINFGARDYTYSAYSMAGVAAISIPCVVYLSAHNGFINIWITLTIYMFV
ncbi:hypothetical protein GUJ93_ZPchr0004g38263 [Zizania palustris]|uniref:Uncharacterized protein n=1 Tax=Zizania palustris TaxID=103762 RepID=A0A8J5SF26_ZIZPA|nr:hypothetical protein GUJ93_ZPchr0004g38263 [Zizania palustris]